MTAPEETVTVVDPRHPLFGRTLLCLGIANSSHRGRCCIVWLRPSVERHVPVEATSLEYDPTSLYPLPISVESLRQFLQEYPLAIGGHKGEPADDAETACDPSPAAGGCSPSKDPAQPCLENAHPGATSSRAPGARHHVSRMPRAQRGEQS